MVCVPGSDMAHAPVVRRRGRPVRLTRRGRIVVLALLFAVAAVALLVASSTGEAAVPAGAAPTVVVRPGETLWDVATHNLPGREPFEAIEDIRRLNDIKGYTVYAGQTLTLPPRR